VESFPASASPRRYVRMYLGDGSSVVGASGPSVRENDAFLYFSRHLHAMGLPVPRVLAVAEDHLCYIQEDLGDVVLWDAVAQGRKSGVYSAQERRLLCDVMRALPALQCRGAEGADWSVCYPQPSFDRRMVMFDLHYFKYCYLKTSGVEFDESLLEDEFENFADRLCSIPADAFMHRDFQARNVMLRENGVPYFIDYQGGRRGPVHYDVASFVWQASAAYPDELKRELVAAYMDALEGYREVDSDKFMDELKNFVLFRTFQVLGAYGFRGNYQGKVRFQRSTVFGLKNLEDLLLGGSFFGKLFPEYPYFTELARHLADDIAGGNKNQEEGTLVVEVCSFSYMQGIPGDTSLNGGGYVFDCRGMLNPGRVPQFRRSTGMDADVARWLEEKGEVQTYLSAAYRMGDAHVRKYLERGLSHLMFSFGCTGGQHRSVYCAGKMAEHLVAEFAGERVIVRLNHREQYFFREWSLEGMSRANPVGKVCFIPAAGMGTRLRPLTDHIPKALAPVCGRPMISALLDRLYAAGWRKAVVNLHHKADMLEEYLRFSHRECWPGMELLFSDERECLLDTGGALKRAGGMLCDGAPFLIHNVDIASDADLSAFYSRACETAGTVGNSAAVLLVTRRESSRQLLFDDRMHLVGWLNRKTGEVRGPVAASVCIGAAGTFGISGCRVEDVDLSGLSRLAFSGISVMMPCALELMAGWPDVFSVIDFYLSVCDSVPVLGMEYDTMITDLGRYSS